jgi:hypothetical protein
VEGRVVNKSGREGEEGKEKKRGKESIQMRCGMVRVEYAPKIVESEETEPE